VGSSFSSTFLVWLEISAGRWAYGLEDRAGREMGLIYSRVNNPGLEILEDRLALWDRSDAALSFPSGMAAITTSVLAVVKPGDTILFSMPVYGGVDYLFHNILPKFGIRTVEFDNCWSEEKLRPIFEEYRETLALVYLETPSNPNVRLVDIEMAVRLTESTTHGRDSDHKPLVFCDNTFLGPVFQKPMQFGVDLVIYSATKFLGGHNDLVAGLVSGRMETIDRIRGYRTIMGTVPDPFNCWLLLRSLETLQIRMEKQSETATKLANFLHEHSAVERVNFPSLLEKGDPQRTIYDKQCTGPGGMVAFYIRGGKRAAFRFLNAVRIAKLAVSLGGTTTLVEHPSSMTHSDVEYDVQTKYEIDDRLIRLAVGLEDADDLIRDLEQALDVSQQDN